MKVTLLGATGNTGPVLIQEALKRGYDVTAFARTSSQFKDSRIKIIYGEYSNKIKLSEAIKGADAVVSALGPTKINHPLSLPILQAYKSVIETMEAVGVKRLIATSTPTAPDPEDKSLFTVWFPALLIHMFLRTSYNDMVAYPNLIRGSKLDWTMVRLNLLKNRPATRKISIGLCGQVEHTLTVSREDVAIFMMDQIEDKSFINQAPAISNKK